MNARAMVVVAWLASTTLVTGCAPKAPPKPAASQFSGMEVSPEMLASMLAGVQDAQRSAREAQIAADRCVLQRPREATLEEERAAGEALARVFVSRGEGLFLGAPDADELTRYLNRVGKLVAARSSRPALPWVFGVLRTETPVATSAPGGYVFVSRGALRLMTTEAQLAGALAHQIAHVALRHDVAVFAEIQEQRCRHQVLSNSMRFAVAGLASTQPAPEGITPGANKALEAGVSKATRSMVAMLVAQTAAPRDEPAADDAAFEMLVRAGYNPEPWTASLDAVPEWKAETLTAPEARRKQLGELRDRLAIAPAPNPFAKDLAKLPVVPLKDELKAAR
jgi:predicted Zn-dependent protease